jgi:hypothetical protein
MHNQDSMITCNAKTRSGGSCQKPPLQGKTRCRLHGGLSLSGTDHPNYIHGKRSKATVAHAKASREQVKALELVCYALWGVHIGNKPPAGFGCHRSKG